MESKKFYLGEHFTSYDNVKEKMKKYEKEKSWNAWMRDSRKTEAARVKKYNPAIRFCEIRYACKKWKYWSAVIVVSRFSSGVITVYDQKNF